MIFRRGLRATKCNTHTPLFLSSSTPGILTMLCTLLCYSCYVAFFSVLFVRDLIVNMFHRFSERRTKPFLVVFSGDWVATNEHFVASVTLELKIPSSNISTALCWNSISKDLPHITHHTSHITHHTSHITHHTSHITHHTSHITHHTSHITHHTSHITHHTSHITHHTSHITHHTSHITHHTSHITHHTSHITHHTSHITHHTSHITHHTSHITHHTSHITHQNGFSMRRVRC